MEHLPPDFVKTLTRHVKMINYFGINIFEKEDSTFLQKYGRFLFLTSLLVPMFVGQILYFVWNKNTGASFLDTIDAVPSTLVVVQARSIDKIENHRMYINTDIRHTAKRVTVASNKYTNPTDFVKLYVTASRREQIRKLILEIGELWPRNIADEEKRNVFDKWKQRIDMYDKAYYACEISSLALFELAPLAMTIYSLKSDPNTPYGFPVQIYFFCFLTSHLQYAMSYVYFVFMCTMIHMCIYVSCDLLLISFTFHVSTMLSLLEHELRNLVSTADESRDCVEENCEDISKIVIAHQKYLSLASDMSEIFGAMVFTQVSFSALIICCYGFLVVVSDFLGLSHKSAKRKDAGLWTEKLIRASGITISVGLVASSLDKGANGMLARSLSVALAMVFALFVLMWPGQLLVDTSSNIAVAAYDSPWYERGIKFRKYISIILIRSQTPCYLSGLGFSELTLASFSKVLSTSWSYLSLLKQMYADMEN